MKELGFVHAKKCSPNALKAPLSWSESWIVKIFDDKRLIKVA